MRFFHGLHAEEGEARAANDQSRQHTAKSRSMPRGPAGRCSEHTRREVVPVRRRSDRRPTRRGKHGLRAVSAGPSAPTAGGRPLLPRYSSAAHDLDFAVCWRLWSLAARASPSSARREGVCRTDRPRSVQFAGHSLRSASSPARPRAERRGAHDDKGVAAQIGGSVDPTRGSVQGAAFLRIRLPKAAENSFSWTGRISSGPSFLTLPTFLSTGQNRSPSSGAGRSSAEGSPAASPSQMGQSARSMMTGMRS